MERRMITEKQASWQVELRRIATEVSSRAALSEDETKALIDEATRRSRQRRRILGMPNEVPCRGLDDD